jgi:hypothetical protein
MYPVARTDGLNVKRMGSEAVVFDPESGNVHHLNNVAEVVWRACDGKTDVAGLTRIVARVTNVDNPGPAVELALEQLSSRGLLSTNVERANSDRRRNRRDALKTLAKAMAIPIVLTLTASRARAQTISDYCPGGCATQDGCPAGYCRCGTFIAGPVGQTCLSSGGPCFPCAF